MKNELLKQNLKREHQRITDVVQSISDDRFYDAPPGKWTSVQHLKHVQLCMEPSIRLLSDKPKFVSKLFGETKEGSRSYESISLLYQNGLVPGIVSPERFVPDMISLDDKEKTLIDFMHKVGLLADTLDLYAEEELDQYLIPHPLLGLITLREMMHFYTYHAAHHINRIYATILH